MKFLIICFTVSFIYLFGCGNDSTTNNGNTGNGETVIFSMDSLSIYLNSNLVAKDTNIRINDANNIKMKFQSLTNADSISTLALFRITAFDSTNFFIDTLNNHHSLLNSQHTIIVNGSNQYDLKILIQMSRGDTTSGYIKLKDIKISKF